MINITRLYCGGASASDTLRYGVHAPAEDGERSFARPASAAARKPVVVWNLTRRCNLNCLHCYTDSRNRHYPGELSTEEARAVVDDLARFGVPAILFSGGEPLLRPDVFGLAALARTRGIRPVLSTNGTLITRALAERIKDTGFSYVGISLDGLGKNHDRFRGMKGAFAATIAGFRDCLAVGQKVGLRLTLTRHNLADLDGIFDFIERERIPRACFYHLVYSGRGSNLREVNLSPAETRAALDKILARTEDFHRRGLPVEVLTVDNHVDGVYLYFKLLGHDPARAAQVYDLLKWNGGGRYSSGVGIACLDPQGNVHADQFWSDYSFGNVRHRPFSEIWTDVRDPLLAGLRDRLPRLKGRCGRCRWQEVCGGSFRVRALHVYGDPWQEDPACYLTEEEIARGGLGGAPPEEESLRAHV